MSNKTTCPCEKMPSATIIPFEVNNYCLDTISFDEIPDNLKMIDLLIGSVIKKNADLNLIPRRMNYLLSYLDDVAKLTLSDLYCYHLDNEIHYLSQLALEGLDFKKIAIKYGIGVQPIKRRYTKVIEKIKNKLEKKLNFLLGLPVSPLDFSIIFLKELDLPIAIQTLSIKDQKVTLDLPIKIVNALKSFGLKDEVEILYIFRTYPNIFKDIRNIGPKSKELILEWLKKYDDLKISLKYSTISVEEYLNISSKKIFEYVSTPRIFIPGLNFVFEEGKIDYKKSLESEEIKILNLANFNSSISSKLSKYNIKTVDDLRGALSNLRIQRAFSAGELKKLRVFLK